MVQPQEYTPIPPREKQNLSKQLAGLLFLHRSARIWDGHNCKTEQVIRWCENCTPLCDDIMREWLKWKGYIAGKRGSNRIHWMKWFLSELDLIFRDFNICRCSPDSVREASRIYLNAVKQLYWETGVNDPEELCRLTRNDWEKLETATIALFFKHWMDTQPQMRQSIRDFAKSPFGNPISEDVLSSFDEEDTNAKSFLDKRYRALIDAHEDIRIMQEMGRHQKQYETHEKIQIVEYSAQGYLLPYTQLCAMDFIAGFKPDTPTSGRDTSCFRIFKYISQRSDIFRTSSYKKSYTKIANACKDYVSVLDQIAQWGKKSETGRIANPKKYVIGSMMAMELEEAYRLHLASAVAAISDDRKRNLHVKDRKKLESTILSSICVPIPIKTALIDEKNAAYFQCNLERISAHNILNYATDLKYTYTAPPQESETYISKTVILRSEQLDLLLVLCGVFGNQLKNQWSEDDYEEVADFLYHEYNVIDALRKIHFPLADDTESKEHYTKMRKFYEMVQSWTSDGSNQAYRYYRKAKDS